MKPFTETDPQVPAGRRREAVRRAPARMPGRAGRETASCSASVTSGEMIRAGHRRRGRVRPARPVFRRRRHAPRHRWGLEEGAAAPGRRSSSCIYGDSLLECDYEAVERRFLESGRKGPDDRVPQRRAAATPATSSLPTAGSGCTTRSTGSPEMRHIDYGLGGSVRARIRRRCRRAAVLTLPRSTRIFSARASWRGSRCSRGSTRSDPRRALPRRGSISKQRSQQQ